jgi:hypothetical protein
MKNIKQYLTIILIFIVNINLHGQISIDKVNDTSACYNIPCNPNTFWLLYNIFNPNPSGNTSDSNIIAEYTLINNVITPVTLNKAGAPFLDRSLIYTNFGCPNATKTFYHIDTNVIRRFNPNLNNWDSIVTNLGIVTANASGGAGGSNFIVFYKPGINCTGCFDIVRLKFNNLNQITDTIIYPWNINSLSITQLAIDNLNQIWFFEHIGNSSGWWVATNLKCLDNMGNVIHDYPLNFYCDLYGATGTFIMNNKIYVGTNSSNGPSPTDLIPFSIINDTVVREPSINFIAPPVRISMASCNPGTLVSVNEIPTVLKDLSVYPNPATSNFTVYLPYKTSEQAQITVINSQGQLIYSSAAIDYNTINCSTWSRGVYLINLQLNGKIITSKKIVLE